MKVEIWKQIPAYPLYEASTAGRIRRIGKTECCKFFTTNRRRDRRPGKLKGREHEPRDYCAVRLYKNGKATSVTVHRIILETFVGKRPPGLQCRHLDDDPRNNRLSNLCWGTRQQNHMDRLRNNKKKKAA